MFDATKSDAYLTLGALGLDSVLVELLEKKQITTVEQLILRGVRALLDQGMSRQRVSQIRKHLLRHGWYFLDEGPDAILSEADIQKKEKSKRPTGRLYDHNDTYLAGLSSENPVFVQKSLDQLARANQPLVHLLAKKWSWACGSKSYVLDAALGYNDLMQAGNEGLIYAIKRFNAELGYAFTSYARFWIVERMRQCVNDRGVIRIPRNVTTNMLARRKFLDHVPTGSDVQDECIRKHMGLSLYAYQSVLSGESVRRARYVSLDVSFHEDHATVSRHLDLHDQASQSQEDGSRSRFDELIFTEHLFFILKKLCDDGVLNQRECYVLIKCFGLDEKPELTLKEIGIEFGLTRERVRQIKEHVLKKLRSPENKHYFEELMSP